jgi:hypothetical protein
MYEVRELGGFVPRFVRIRLLPEADGDPVRAFSARPAADPSSNAAADRVSLAAKTTMAFDALERWVGRPTLDAILAEFVRRSRGMQPTIGDFVRVASAVSGQDLTWLLAQSLSTPYVFDYAVATITSEPASSGSGFETRVVVARLGDGIFSGATAPRVDGFESGRAIAVAVRFAGGDSIVDRWDGRDATKTFVYRSTSRAVSASVDPDELVTLDRHRTNNGRSLAPSSGVAARRWAARWLVWLEHALLNYAFFV